MEMTRIEKLLVNREPKGLRNVARVKHLLQGANTNSIRDVLEIGCGIGTVSARLADEYGWNVTGTDYDARQIEEAKNRYPEAGGLRYAQQDATRLTFADASFDLAIAQMVFHHIPNWQNAVTELARVLRPGGMLIWYDVAAPAWLAGLAKPAARWVSLYTQQEVDGAFAEAKLELLKGQHGYNFVLRDLSRLYRKPMPSKKGKE